MERRVEKQITKVQEKIIAEAKKVTEDQFKEQLLKGGEFNMIEISGKKPQIRIDIDGKTIESSIEKIYEMIGINVDKLNFDSTDLQFIGKFEIEKEGKEGDINSFNITNMSSGQEYHIAWHDEGHANQTYDKNSTKSHFNLGYTITSNNGRVTINSHIYYD